MQYSNKWSVQCIRWLVEELCMTVKRCLAGRIAEGFAVSSGIYLTGLSSIEHNERGDQRAVT